MEIFLSMLIGLLWGNLLTSVYSRSKTGKTIIGIGKSGIKPHCDNCHHKLKFYEYMAILSWFTCRFKCNYCNKKYTMEYFYIEISFGILSLIIFLIYGFTYLYLMIFLSLVSSFAILVKCYYFLIHFSKK